MFEIVYAKSISKDLKKIAPQNLAKIKTEIEELRNFPDLAQIKHLTNHSLADFRLRIGDYRVLFDVNWKDEKIQILKVDKLVKSQKLDG